MKQVSTFGARLKEALESADLSYTDIGQKVGLSKQAISSYITGVRIPKKPTIEVLARALNVSEPWLCGLDAIKGRNGFETFPIDFFSRVPIIGTVYAGINGIAQEDFEGYGYAADLRNPENYRYFRVKGNSMLPDIKQGDLALVRMQECIESGELAVVIIDGEEGVIKRVQIKQNSIILISNNTEEFPPRVFVGKERADIRIWGKVVKIEREY